jgi:hypothetical protein
MKPHTQLSPTEVNEMTVTEAEMIPTNTITRNEIYSGNTNANDQSELKTMFASVLTKLETSHRESKERHSFTEQTNNLETSHRDLENKLEISHRENNDKFQRDIEIKLETLQENMKTDFKTEIEKLIQRFDLASENQVAEISNQEKTDVVLRRQGERVEQIQLQVNQVSVLDQELQYDAETVDPLEIELIDLADESQEVEFTIPEQTEVILRRQGEQAERKLEEICVGDFDSGEVKAKEIMEKCKEVTSAPHPLRRKRKCEQPKHAQIKYKERNCRGEDKQSKLFCR